METEIDIANIENVSETVQTKLKHLQEKIKIKEI